MAQSKDLIVTKTLDNCEDVLWTGKGKGKAIPLQAWTDPEGSRRLRLPDF
jgi:hypothetical protein